MDVSEVLRVVWRRRVVALAALLLVLALGALSLVVQAPVYQSTSTIALVPAETNDEPLFIISQIDVITPLYAEAIEANTTKQMARDELDGGRLGDVSVRTFRGAPILKIDVRSGDADSAQAGAQAITEALLERVDDADVGLSNALVIRQIDRPQVPDEPIRPLPKLTMLVAALIGLAAAVSAALLRERSAGRVDTAEDLESIVGAPCFGRIPADRAVPSISSPSALVSDTRHRIVAEALRDIRTNIQFTDGNIRSIVVTSPEGSHGKSFTAFGLAATFARAGARTVLIDGDLRRGRLSELVGAPRAPGLMEVLRGAPLSSAIQHTDLDNLSLLAGGALENDPGELIESAFFPVLYDLEAAYEVVIIDATPLVPVNDARFMARYASNVLLVVASGTLRRRQVRTAVERLAIIGMKPSAVVLNVARERKRAGYYRYLAPQEQRS